ncbi:MAG TPA: dihydroorotase, partial [Cyclobacteriaceae bacterium]
TCDVTSYQPLLDDSLLSDFDTNYKVNPPLRESKDQDALLKGLKDGTIDILCSGHTPHDDESKVLEFDMAEFGIINLQTFAAQLTSLSEEIEWSDLIGRVTDNPRRILGMEVPVIDVDAKANLTLFDPSREWTFTSEDNKSASKNSPWLGKILKGKAIGCVNNNRQWFNV